MNEKNNEIILFENQGVKLEVNLSDETVWLNRQQLAELFDRDIKTIAKHINNALNDADTESRKKELFEKVRTGQVRVLMGSTAKMGAGTNVKNKIV